MPIDRRSVHSSVVGSSEPTTQTNRLSDNQWLADEVYPAIGASQSNSRSQSRSRKTSPLDNNRIGRTSLDNSNTIVHARDMPAGSIAFAEGYKPKRERSKSRSRMSSESSYSTPRSRSRSTYDTHRLSTHEKVWTDAKDKERKHGEFLEKVLSHKLSPAFLK